MLCHISQAEFYGRVNPSDPHALAYMYDQSIYDVMQSQCLIPLKAAVDLAGINVYIEAAKAGQPLPGPEKVQSMLYRYLPSRLLQQIPIPEVEAVAMVSSCTCIVWGESLRD